MISSRFLAVLTLLTATALRAQTITYVNTDTKNSTQAIASGTFTLQIDSGSATESGVFSGAGGLIKNGAGTLTLTGSSTYTGGTTINAGTLVAGVQGEKGTFASGSTVTVNSGGTLSVYGDSLGWGNSPAKLVLNGGTLVATAIANDGAHTTLQDVTMTGGLITYSTNGRYVLNGPLTTLASSSTATIDASVELLSGWAGGPATTFTVASGTTSSGVDLDVSGVLFGSGPVIKNGAGTLRLGGANSYTGGTTLNAGTLLLNSSGALGTSGTIAFGGGTLKYSGSNATDYSSRFSTAAGQKYAIDTNSQSVTLAGNLTSSGGSLTKLGTGTLTLSGNNTYDGGTTLAGGTLTLGSAGALGTTGTISFTGGTLQYSSANTTDYSSRFNPGANQQYLIDTNGQNLSFNTGFSGTGSSLTKLGAGTLTLLAPNQLTGGITVSAGTLAFTNPASLGIYSLQVSPGATASFGVGNGQFAASSALSNLGTFAAGSYLGLDTTAASGPVTYGSAIFSGLNLRKLGTGTLVFATQSFNISDVSLEAGALSVTASLSGAASTGTVRASDGTTLTLSSTGQLLAGSGGTGSNGFAANGGGGGSGAGGAVFGASGTLVNGGQIIGGNGGAGGTSQSQNIPIAGGLKGGHGGNGGNGGTGVAMGDSANVTNQTGATIAGGSGGTGGFGDISSGTFGANAIGLVVGASSTVVNAGTITGGGTNGAGVLTGNGSTLTNTGTIKGGSSSSGTGVSLSNGSTLINSGTISGSNAVVGNDVTIVNSGTMGSIALGGTTNTLELRAGYQVTGTVTAGGTNDTLFLGGGADASFDISGLGDASRFRNFENFVKTGPSTWTLILTSQYLGSITVSQGTLQLGDGVIHATLSNNISNQANLAFNPPATSTYVGTLSGSGTANKIGTGVQILAGTNTDTGLFTVSSGTLQYAKTVSFINGQSASWDSSHLTVAPGATAAFNLGGTGEFGPADIMQIAGAAGIFQAGSYLGLDPTNAPSGTYTFAGNLGDTAAGALGLAKLGTGTLVLSGTNTYSGGTLLTAGTLAVSAPSQLGTGAVTFNGGTLRPTASTTLSQSLVLNSAASTVDIGSGLNAAFSGAISGLGHLTKTGTGTLTLSGTQTLGTDLTLSTGVLAVSGSLGTAKGSMGTDTVASGAAANVVTGAAGTEVDVATTGSITAGAGGDGYNQRVFASGSTNSSPRYAGASGGIAVNLGNTATLNNQGTVTGGAGGAGTVHTTTSSATTSLGAVDAGGAGGTGAKLGTSGTVINSGAINGGAGCSGGNGTSFVGNDGRVYPGGAGGTGLDLGASAALTNTGSITGGAGGNSGAIYGAPGWGGAGGAGGTAASLGANSTIGNSGTVTGGNGGNSGLIQSSVGGSSGNLHGDVGGAGGTGFALGGNVTLTNGGTIAGGNGGNGTTVLTYSNTVDTADPGNGGAAGTGVSFGSGGSLTNTGTIQGGNGGAGGQVWRNGSISVSYGSGVNAAGGAAITGSALSIVNSGNITAGLSGDGVARGNAIVFSGTGNSLTLNPTSVITGNVVGSTTGTDTFVLGSGTDVTFASVIGATGQYQNFDSIQKSGTNTWTLTADSSFTGTTTVSGGTLQFGNGGTAGSLGSGALTNNAALVINRSNDFTIANAISGTGSLTKLGAGNATLTGTNTYSGLTTLSGGTLTLYGGSALGPSSTVVFAGGTLNLANGYVGSAASQFSTASAQAYRIGVSGSDSAYLTTGIGTSASSLTKLGTGSLQFGAANLYTGGTTLAGGILDPIHLSWLGTGGLTFDGGMLSLQIDGGQFAQDVTVNAGGGTIRNGTSSPLTLTGNLSGSGKLTKLFSGLITLPNATPDFTGAVQVSAGALYLTNPGALSGNAFALTGGTVRFGAIASASFGSLSGTTGLDLTNVSSNGTPLDGSAGVALSAGSDNTSTAYSGALSGTGSLTKVGTGTLTLSGVNTYAGNTTLAGGTLSVSNDNQLGDVASNLVFQGGTLQTTTGLTSARTLTVTDSGTINVAAGQTSSFSNLSGGGNLTKAGTGALSVDLSGNSGYTGNLALSAGSLNLQVDDAADYAGAISGGGALAKSGAGTLVLTGTNTYSGNTTVSAGTLQFGSGGAASGFSNSTAGITDNGSLAFNSSSALSYSGVISGSGSLTKDGTGTLTLSGGNSYLGGTTISSGTLVMGSSSALGSGSVFIDTNGTLNLGTQSLDTSKVTGSGRVISTGAIALPNTSDLTVALRLSGASSIAKTGTNTLTLSGANDYSGGTTLTDGTLALASNSALGTGTVTLNGGSLVASGGARTIANNLILNADTTIGGSQALTLNGGLTLARNRDLTVDNTAITTINGSISQSGGTRVLLKYGEGELRLNGANLYNGGTTIAEGTVRINNTTGSAFGTGAVTVEQGATLAGSGSFTGALQLNGTFSPGNSPGTTHTGSEVWAGGAGYLWQINDGNGLKGVNYDFVSINGTLTIEADATTPFTVSLESLLANNTAGDVAHFDATQNHAYTFATASLGIIGFNTADFTLDTTAFTNDLLGGVWKIMQDGNNLNLVFTAATVPVPEPATWVALAGLAALALALQRRRRS